MEIIVRESIVIDNFAGIKHIQLDINRINLLIGPQATGKSICAKLLYFFKAMPNEMVVSIQNFESFKDFQAKTIEKFIKYFPREGWGSSQFCIKYELGDLFIRIEKNQVYSDIEISVPEYYALIFTELGIFFDGLFKNRDEKYATPEYIPMILKNEINKIIVNKYGLSSLLKQLFIPAGRSVFAFLQQTIFTLLSNNSEIDPFISEFGSIYELAKKQRIYRQGIDKETNYSPVDVLIDTILLGSYSFEKGKDYLNLIDGRKVNVAYSSSGQQELLPLVLMLRFLLQNRFPENGATVYIEEPEAHIFPTDQKNMVDLIASIFNKAVKPLQFVITTHSPYLLTSFNNLIQAGIVEEKLPQTKLEKLYDIVGKDKILDPTLVSAYSLHDGISESIIDPETGLVSASSIDEVSDALSIQYGELLEMENNELFREM